MLVTGLSILPLIATLGTFFVYSGAALGAHRRRGASGRAVLAALCGDAASSCGIPVPFLTHRHPVFALAGMVLMSTAWGRWIYAMGFNERSAQLVGIPVDRVRLHPLRLERRACRRRRP